MSEEKTGEQASAGQAEESPPSLPEAKVQELTEEQKKANELAQLKKVRQERATKRFMEILEEENCEATVRITIGTDGKITGKVEIYAR